MKKIIIIVLATILCLSVVGGCFALYSKEVEDFTFTFGAEDAVTLTLSTTGLSDDDSRTFNFGGDDKINPSTSVSQVITLDVNTTEKGTLQGLNGILSVAISGDLASNLQIKIKADSTTYDGSSVELALNNLPKNLTLELSLKASSAETKLDEEFKTLSGKTAKVVVSWKFKKEEWTAKDGYYIVNLDSDWGVNKNAIYLDKDLTGSSDLGAIESVYLKENQQFKVVYYTASSGIIDWRTQKINSYASSVLKQVTKDDEGNDVYDGNLYVTTSGNYFLCVNKDGDVYCELKTSN